MLCCVVCFRTLINFEYQRMSDSDYRDIPIYRQHTETIPPTLFFGFIVTVLAACHPLSFLKHLFEGALIVTAYVSWFPKMLLQMTTCQLRSPHPPWIKTVSTFGCQFCLFSRLESDKFAFWLRKDSFIPHNVTLCGPPQAKVKGFVLCQHAWHGRSLYLIFCVAVFTYSAS